KNKKTQILEAAAILFRDKGYSATSMRDLASVVDLKASSLYNHIKSKQEILREICFDNANRFIQEMNEVEALDIKADQKVKTLILMHVDIAINDVTSVTAFNDEWRHLDEPHLSNFLELRKDYELRFRNIIDQGMEMGLLRKMESSIMLYTIFSSLRWVHDWFKPNKRIDQNELKRQLTEMLMNGILKQ
ncbi:MAG: TetR/AcrR family transcriptional regulator, partial [Bacteroidota bacterium]